MRSNGAACAAASSVVFSHLCAYLSIWILLTNGQSIMGARAGSLSDSTPAATSGNHSAAVTANATSTPRPPTSGAPRQPTSTRFSTGTATTPKPAMNNTRTTQKGGNFSETRTSTGGSQKVSTSTPTPAAHPRRDRLDNAILGQMHLADLIPEDYDRFKWPAPSAEEPVRVSVAVALGKLQSVNEADRSITFEIYLELAWREPRLNLPANLSATKIIPLPADLIKYLWVPDPYILNLRNLKSATVVKPPRGLEISGDYMVRMTSMGIAEVGCNMDFRMYPVDTQVCRIRLQSFEYEIDDVVFEWGAALDNFAHLGNEDFIVETAQIKAYNKTYFGQSLWNGRRFSRLEFRYVLQRRFSYHLLETYLPSVLFVMCGWFSFLVKRSAIPGRVTLCVTTLLSMTAMVAAVKKLTPHSQYIKAIETWLLTCLCFIFYSLFAFLVALKIASFDKTIERVRDLRRPQVVYTVNGNDDARDDEANNKVDTLPMSILRGGGADNTAAPAGNGGNNRSIGGYFGPPSLPPDSPSAVLLRTSHVGRWKKAADWFELASFVAYPVAFGAFAIWYWHGLLEASERYKYYIPKHD